MDPVTLGLLLGGGAVGAIGKGVQAEQANRDRRANLQLQADLLKDRQWHGLGGGPIGRSESVFVSALGGGLQGAGVGASLGGAISGSGAASTDNITEGTPSQAAIQGREAESMYAKNFQGGMNKAELSKPVRPTSVMSKKTAAEQLQGQSVYGGLTVTPIGAM